MIAEDRSETLEHREPTITVSISGWMRVKQASGLAGSGTAAILSIARAIERNGIIFKSNVQLVAFVSPLDSTQQKLQSFVLSNSMPLGGRRARSLGIPWLRP